MTIREKIDEYRNAYNVLKPYVDEGRYFAHLAGLMEAYQIETNAKMMPDAEDKSNSSE